MNPIIRALLVLIAAVVGLSGYTPEVEPREPIRVQSEGFDGRPVEATAEGEVGDTTPAPANAPSAAPVLVPVTLADLLPRDQVFTLALDVSGSESWAAEATAVAYCESRFDPSALGSAGEEGILQIHPIHVGLHQRYDLFDPKQNLEAAHELWSTEGWAPWSCALAR